MNDWLQIKNLENHKNKLLFFPIWARVWPQGALINRMQMLKTSAKEQMMLLQVKNLGKLMNQI